jgi:futalosine hydrolase
VILLAAAVEAELAFWRHRDGVATLVTGVGPVEAACAIAAELARAPYGLLVNAGLGGAFDGAAAIGDGVVVAEDTMELDLEDGTPLRLPQGKRTISLAHSDGLLVERMLSRGFSALRGVTVARVTSTEATAGRLAGGGAQVESMEGFAALRAAELAGVAAIEVRGISNRCGGRESSGWNFEAGMAGLQRALAALVEICDAGEW